MAFVCDGKPTDGPCACQSFFDVETLVEGLDAENQFSTHREQVRFNQQGNLRCGISERRYVEARVDRWQ